MDRILISRRTDRSSVDRQCLPLVALVSPDVQDEYETCLAGGTCSPGKVYALGSRRLNSSATKQPMLCATIVTLPVGRFIGVISSCRSSVGLEMVMTLPALVGESPCPSMSYFKHVHQESSRLSLVSKGLPRGFYSPGVSRPRELSPAGDA